MSPSLAAVMLPLLLLPLPMHACLLRPLLAAFLEALKAGSWARCHTSTERPVLSRLIGTNSFFAYRRMPALGVTLVHELGLGQPLSATAAAAAAAASNTPTRANSGSSLGVGSGSGGSESTAAATAAAPSGTSGAGSSTTAWSSALPGIITKFRAAVQAEFPQLYAWFDDASLHITVRAIIV